MANQEVQAKEKEEKHEKASSMEILAEWKESVEGQWGHVQEEWKEERERLNKAREEWEAKLGALTSANASSDAHVIGNGGVFNGLVTPPSPRSQSSNSLRYPRRRRRASSGSPTG
jgi:hypothetical protein